LNEVDRLIDGLPEPQRAIVRRLRAAIREVAPDLEESVKWGAPVYGRGSRNLLSLIPHRAHVNLQVFNGAAAPDPEGLLEGTGKGLRHVKCRTLADAERPGLRALMLEAAKAAGPTPP